MLSQSNLVMRRCSRTSPIITIKIAAGNSVSDRSRKLWIVIVSQSLVTVVASCMPTPAMSYNAKVAIEHRSIKTRYCRRRKAADIGFNNALAAYTTKGKEYRLEMFALIGDLEPFVGEMSPFVAQSAF
jgi:hypothetical protein